MALQSGAVLPHTGYPKGTTAVDTQNNNRVMLLPLFGASCFIFGSIINARPEILGDGLSNLVAVAVAGLMICFFVEALRRPMSPQNGYTKNQVAVALGTVVVFTITVMLSYSWDLLVLSLMTAWVVLLMATIYKHGLGIVYVQSDNRPTDPTEPTEPTDVRPHIVPGMSAS